MVLVLVLLLTQAPPPPRDQKPGAALRNAVVAGRVVDAETDTPIAHALVEVWPKGPGARRIGVETGARGEFRVVDLPTGAYRIVASPPDFHATHASEELTVARKSVV